MEKKRDQRYVLGSYMDFATRMFFFSMPLGEAQKPQVSPKWMLVDDKQTILENGF
jgi:hypothetical protein